MDADKQKNKLKYLYVHKFSTLAKESALKFEASLASLSLDTGCGGQEAHFAGLSASSCVSNGLKQWIHTHTKCEQIPCTLTRQTIGALGPWSTLLLLVLPVYLVPFCFVKISDVFGCEVLNLVDIDHNLHIIVTEAYQGKHNWCLREVSRQQVYTVNTLVQYTKLLNLTGP